MNSGSQFYLKWATLLLLFISVSNAVFARRDGVMNMEDHDQKRYYFGLSFGMNTSAFKIRPSAAFTMDDSIKSIQPGWGPGFHIGLMGSLRLSKFIDLRFVPKIAFAEKRLTATMRSNAEEGNTIESIYTQLPLQLKFKSDRMQNFRFYGLLGGRFDYDLASNARSRRSNELIRVKPIDISAEVGFGLEFYYPNFMIAPEIKISQGFLNTHFPDNTIYLSNMVDRMNTRMVTFSIQIQG